MLSAACPIIMTDVSKTVWSLKNPHKPQRPWGFFTNLLRLDSVLDAPFIGSINRRAYQRLDILLGKLCKLHPCVSCYLRLRSQVAIARALHWKMQRVSPKLESWSPLKSKNLRKWNLNPRCKWRQKFQPGSLDNKGLCSGTPHTKPAYIDIDRRDY